MIAPIKQNMASKIDFEPMKIKVRYKNVNMNKIKLKFKRDKLNSFNYGSTQRDFDKELFNIEPSTNNFVSHQATQQLGSPFDTSESKNDDISRKTAYFGRDSD